MDRASTTYRVHQCSKCPGGTEYYCESCPCALCQKCTENHVTNLKSVDHNVVSYRDKFNYIPKRAICMKHLSNDYRHLRNIYRKYCEPCQVPVCETCTCIEHLSPKFPISLFFQCKHNIFSIEGAYKTKRQQHRGTIHTIKSEALFYRPLIMPGIKADFKTCRTEFSLYQSEMLTKAQTLKDLITDVLFDLLNNVFCDFDFKHRCLKQKIEMSRHIVRLQIFVHIYEQSAIRSLSFLSSIKKALPQIHLALHTCQLAMTASLNKDDVIESLSGIQIIERGNRRVRKDSLLKLMYTPELHQSLTVTGVEHCSHISCVTSDRVWVTGEKNIFLINTAGVNLHRVEDSCSYFYKGKHTVNSESELIYIDRNYNIKKLSKDMKTTTTLIEKTDPTWEPRCVYWSPSTGDLLVGVCRFKNKTGKVTRYNQSGQLIQTIQLDNTGSKLYKPPEHITENNNGDVVVSGHEVFRSGAVVVMNREGRHRFSYTGPPFGPRLEPKGICTDALSHILVCDQVTQTVQMLDSDGQFLSHLLIRPSGMFTPYCLGYDGNTHRLWVGSSNRLSVYRYIDCQVALTDTADAMESLSEISITETEKPQRGNQCLLKLMSSAKLLHSLSVTGVLSYGHVSCLTSGWVWVCDNSNLVLSNETGVNLHCVKDVLGGSRIYDYGSHTVNSKSELIYIDRKYNINKLSKDMKTTTTLMKTRFFSKWRPLCVYCSPSTGDLLVGMYREVTRIGKVTRYNQNGQLTQTIQNDNTGLELYTLPCYITENNNGDVVVSDKQLLMPGVVVVTDRGGRQRFSYSGHPLGSGLKPYGICTDALSHILVCDGTTKTVQMLNKDGQFLSYLLAKSQVMGEPRGLSYDVNTHCLWVGSRDCKKLYVYSYIDRQDVLTDKQVPHPHADTLPSSACTLAVEWR